MKKAWMGPSISTIPCDVKSIQGEIEKMSDKELMEQLEKCGYQPQKKYSAKKTFIHRSIAGTDVLISVGKNIANFNGYIQINSSGLCLWKQMKEPSTVSQLETVLEKRYGITHEQAAEDVLDFLKVLTEHDMVIIE